MICTHADVECAPLLAAVAEVFEKYATWERELNAIIASGGSYARFGAVTRKMTRNPFFVTSGGQRILFHEVECLKQDSPAEYRKYCELTSGTMSPMASDGYPSETALRDVVSNPHFTVFLENDEPAPFPQEGWPYETIAYNLGPKGERRGAICMDSVVHPIERRDYAIIKVLGDFVDLAVLSSASPRFKRSAEQNYVIDNLLAHRYINSWRIAEALREIGWDMFDTYACVAIESASFDKSEKLLSAYAPRIGKLLRTGYQSVLDGHLAVVVNLSKHEFDLAGLAELLCDHLSKGLLIAGVSRSYEDFKDLYYYHRQAVSALHACRTSDSTVCSYEQVAATEIVARCRRDDPKEAMTPAGLKALIGHDREKGSNFVDLLRIYLESELSVTETAKRSFIARNTCFYRLKRIQEISGIDLGDSDARLCLEVALRIMNQELARLRKCIKRGQLKPAPFAFSTNSVRRR